MPVPVMGRGQTVGLEHARGDIAMSRVTEKVLGLTLVEECRGLWFLVRGGKAQGVRGRESLIFNLL